MYILRVPSKCVARLAAGEVKRIPVSNPTYLAGYYIGCPSCGRPQAIPTANAQFHEEGLDVGDTPVLSMSKVECDRCHVCFSIERDEVIVHA